MNLINPSSVPPVPEGVERKGQWTVLIPETETRLWAGDMFLLVQAARENLLANGKPVPANLPEYVGSLICSQLGRAWKGCGEVGPALPGVSWGSIKEWLHVVSEIFKGREPVSQEKAEARAAVCSGGAPGGGKCPNNVAMDDCPACRAAAVATFITKTGLGNVSTSHDQCLGGCAVCGCGLQAKVWVPLDLLDHASHDGQWPDWCWHITEKNPPIPVSATPAASS